MKKLIAIVMSLAMIVTCMPIMAFAEVNVDEEGSKIDEQVKPYNQTIIDYVSDQDLVELYKTYSPIVREYMDTADKIVEQIELLKEYGIDAEVTPDLKEYTDLLDGYIAELNKLIKEYADKPEIAEALNNAQKALEDLKQALEDEEIDSIDDLVARAQEELDKLLATLDEEMIQEALDELIEQAKAWAKDAGFTDEDIEDLFEQLEAIQAIIAEYADMTPSEAIDALIEQAKELVADNAEELEALALEAIGEIFEKFEDGEYDEYIEQLGLDPQTVKEVFNDLINYAFGYALLGESYTDLQDKLMDAEMALWEKEMDIDTLKDQLKEVKASDKKKGEFLKKFVNGYKVTKAKPKMVKVKNLKKKKIKVTFKGLKKLEATKYQIQAKAKKAKVKKAVLKKKTVSAKKLNKTLKKLKKGKKYTVKVRAYYQFKYNGKTYKFWSKWSKAKKVKIKK